MKTHIAHGMVILATIALASMLSVSCTMPEPPVRHALVYGVQDYEGSLNDLSLTDDDARAMQGALEAAGWNVTMRLSVAGDNGATRSAIESDIASLRGTDGLVLFYYSGHGDEYGNIIPFGAIESASERINPEELRGMLSDAGLGNVIILLDSCYSGAFVEDGATTDAVPGNYEKGDSVLLVPTDYSYQYPLYIDALPDAMAALLRYERTSGYVTISAAGSDEEAWESGSHGIFTAAVLDAMEDPASDLDADGYVSSGELFAWTASYIEYWWNGETYSPLTSGDYLPHLSGTPYEFILWEGASRQ